MASLSIIVPVYNVQDYLDRCICSILSQTYKDFELMLIDDGSTDESGNICDCYVKKDGRVRVIHTKNGGAGAARNIGLKNATGAFIGFVDGDDYIDRDMYETMIGAMTDKEDISICGRYIFDADRHAERVEYVSFNKKHYSSQEAVINFLHMEMISTAVWNKVYRKDVLKGVFFPEGALSSEDIPFVYKVLLKSRGLIHIGKAKYHYAFRDGSDTSAKFELRRIGHYIRCKDVAKDAMRRYPCWRNDIEAFYIESAMYCIGKINQDRVRHRYKNIYEGLCRTIRRNMVHLLFNDRISWKRKKEMFRAIILARY